MSYLDTSIVVAYYCPEPLSNAIERLIADIPIPVISSLVEIELSSAISLKVRMRELDISSANAIISRFHLDIANDIYEFVDIGSREYGLARDWLSRFSSSLRTLDALQLAAAFANNLTIITADHALAAAAKHFAVPCRIAID